MWSITVEKRVFIIIVIRYDFRYNKYWSGHAYVSITFNFDAIHNYKYGKNEIAKILRVPLDRMQFFFFCLK